MDYCITEVIYEFNMGCQITQNVKDSIIGSPSSETSQKITVKRDLCRLKCIVEASKPFVKSSRKKT